MLHALRNAVRVSEQDDDMTMLVGPARDGALLEVGVVVAADFDGFCWFIRWPSATNI
jgi:hypothetical protein